VYIDYCKDCLDSTFEPRYLQKGISIVRVSDFGFGQMHATVILIPVVQKHAMGDVSVV
jgi:hypothetical protein